MQLNSTLASGECIDNIACPDCGSSDARQVFQKPDKIDSYCFACDTYFPPEGTELKQSIKDKAKEDLSGVHKLPIRGIPDRGLSEEVCKLYGVRSALSEQDGVTCTATYYPDTKQGVVTGYEKRNMLDKAFCSVGDRKGDVELWGTQVAKSGAGKKLFITEGRLDAMSLYQVICDQTPAKYNHLKPRVVSLTRGAASAVKDLMNNREFIQAYSEVILCFDMDAAGEKATKDVLKVFPEFRVAKMPLKDANACLLAGRLSELYQATVWDSVQVRHGEVVDIHDFIEKAMLKPEMGLSFPWPTVTRACFGIRPHTIHVVGAAPKIGKTDHEHQLVHHLVYHEDQKVGMFDLENSPVKTAKKLASKEAKKDFTRPDIEYEDDELRSTLMGLEGKVRFYDRGASRDWEDIRIAMQEMHLLDGINIFIIDPLTALVSRFSSSEANDALNAICTDMSDFVNSYPVTLFCYTHVNPKPKSSKPHETGAKVYSSEFTGSRAMEKWFHYGHGISRDRTDECPPEDKNVSQFYMLFDRDFGQSYNCDVYFDEATVTYLEPKRRF
jgi:twinkle protein